MKTSLLSKLLIAIIILINCSGDRAVVDRVKIESDSGQSLNMSEDPGPQYPPEYGDDEFTPPFMILISYNAIGDTIGNNRILTVGAYIIDFYARPYTSPGIEINFEIIPDSIANISSPVYSNEQGWAVAKLEYPPVYAFEEIQLITSSDWTADTATLNLPLADPRLELNAEPEILRVNQEGAYDTSNVSCRLGEGMDNYINGGLIKFVALAAGEICGPTFNYTDDHGRAYTQYRIGYDDIPEGNNDPGFIETGVRAMLWGYPDVEEEISLYCYKE